LTKLSSRFCLEETLGKAMSYALSGGKRLRGSILLSFHEACGGALADALDFAAAIEMIQAYSLVHDDLPCMDDDDFRRGKPSCHKEFGYAMALLAGDALLTAAFDVAASSKALSSDRVVQGISLLAGAAGPSGMVAGQVLDLSMEGKAAGVQEVRRMYSLKTGAMFRASAETGAILGGGSPRDLKAAREWAGAFGFAFQVLDDIDDLTQSTKEREKDVLLREITVEDARIEAIGALRASLDILEQAGCRNELARSLSLHYMAKAGPGSG